MGRRSGYCAIMVGSNSRTVFARGSALGWLSIAVCAACAACASNPGPKGTPGSGGIPTDSGGVVSGSGGTTTGAGGAKTGVGGATTGSGGAKTGGTSGTSTGVGGVVCGTRDIPIDSSGFVDVAATGCGITGVWWWATDDKGTVVENATPDTAPYIAGKGMCIKGRTAADPKYAAWGAIIGLDLNANLAAGWNANAQNVVGFDVEVSGSSTGELRVELENLPSRTTSPPFVATTIGRKVVLINRAIVPLAWDVPNSGEKAEATSIRKLQLHVPGSTVPVDFDVCITRVRPIVATCDDYALIDANGYKLNNNTWGKESLTDYSQCVFATGTGPNTRFGWLWRWPPSSPSWQVRGYPEVMAGKSPWNGSLDTGHNLPAPISARIGFAFDLDLELGASDGYDFAPEIWLTSEAQPTSSNVTDEIMFWFLHNGMSPAGSVVGTFSSAGIDYDVWINPNHDPGGGTTVTGWQYVAFVARTAVRSGTVQLDPFLQYLVSNGRIAPNRYLAGIEVGTEIINGTGSAIFNSFQVSVSPQ
jgi:hypothetical protein